jgi:phage baseplate assembly protein W
MINIKFPYQFSAEGKTALTDYERHIKDMIEQILLTGPGERVNRPDFGCGLQQAVFEPNSEEMAATVQFLAQGALNRWLSHLIEVKKVSVNVIDSTLEVKVVYTIIRNKQTYTTVFNK